jgi:hypothetical protein
MKQIFCEHPVIIRNPQLKELLITHRCYTTLTGDHLCFQVSNNGIKKQSQPR